MTYKICKVLVLLLVVGVISLGAFAQNANSTIQGTVKDASGAVVPGATITLTDIGTTQQLTTKSRSDGFYTFTNLSPANYQLSVSASGFANWVGVLTLRVSQSALVDATLNAASVATRVTVQDVTPIIDSVNPTLSDVKNATAIETIPVANRSILNVLAFSPGVVAGGYGGSGNGYTRVNGVIGGSLDYLVDGQTMVNHWSNELQSTPPSTLTFQEVKIMTAGGEAEYGRPGEVELVTKSGTNQFHGQLFELNRNQHLQAKTFNSGPTVPYLQHNEYGGQLGGPVWLPKIYNGKNKTFFFFDIEWIKNNANAVEQYIVPTGAQTGQGGNGADLTTVLDTNGNPINNYDPNSTVYDPVTDTYTRTLLSYNGAPNVIPPNRLNPVVQKIFGNVPAAGLTPYPRPNINNPNIWQYTPNYEPPSSKNTSDEKQITAKVDQIFGPNRLAARYTYTSQNQLTPLYYAPTAPDVRDNGGQNGSLTLTTAIGARAVNVAHIGVQYNHAFRGPASNPAIIGALGLPAYTDIVSWPGFYWFYGNDNYWTSLDRDNPQDYPNQIVSGSDQFSYNLGNHQLMFGFEVDNSRITTYEIGQPGGNYTFDGSFTGLQDPTALNPDGSRNYGVQVNDTGGSLAQLLLGDVSLDILSIYPHYHTRQTEYSGFAQDNWRVNQNLTLTYGLRYEYWTPFSDASGLFSTLDPNVPGGEVIYAGSGPLPAQTPQAVYNSFVAAGLPIESAAAAHYPLSLFTMPKTNFEPRVGFAYQLNDKTVLRGSWGVYQWVMPLQQFQQATRKNPPFSYSALIQPGEIDGVATSTAAAELEFPLASADFGGPQPINQFMLGSQNCTGLPAGTCNPPGLLLNTSNVSVSLGSGFGLVSMNPHVKPSTVQEYNLTLSRILPWHTGFQMSYIGNYQTNLLQFDPINANVPRNSCAVAGSTNVAQCEAGNNFYQRPYTNFLSSNNGNYDENNYNGYGNTNELQVQLTHTWGNGLSLQSYFTWGKFLTTTGGQTSSRGGAPGGQGLLGTGGATNVPAALTPGYSLANPLSSGASVSDRIRAVYGNDPSLPTKTFQLNAHYQLPFGKGQRYLGNAHGVVNALVSGYNISPFFLWHSGFYFGPYSSAFGSNTVSGAPGGRGIILAPGKTGILPKGQRTTSHWFDYSVWDPLSANAYAGQTYEYTYTPQQGDYRNNVPYNYMTGPGFNNLDASLYKLTPLWRNLVFDFEAQIFNVYNHQNLGLPNSHGIILTNVSNYTPRTIQLQAKFVF
jgi:Carboxypeptidase regulatory-like domain/TonB-dependent Receptor Plug Domain